MGRVEFRLADDIVELLCKTYTDASSCNEAVKLFILETLAREVEKRTLPEELEILARAELVRWKRKNR